MSFVFWENRNGHFITCLCGTTFVSGIFMVPLNNKF